MAPEPEVPPLTPVESDRVRSSTPHGIRERIDQETVRRIDRTAAGGRDAISRRLRELDEESDIERYLEVNASLLALAGVVLGATVNRRWLVVPAVVTAFLLQHGIQGWCPPLPLFRRLGVRTRREIDAERYALKVLRGDLATAAPASAGGRAAEAIRALRA